jgi:GTPase
MLIDEVDLTIKAGHGGPGKVSFYPGFKSGPDGGNGGKGGDVYILATSDLTALNRFSREKVIAAENGGGGNSNRKSGRNGNDREIRMPVGTELVDKKSGEVVSLDSLDKKILVCKGGKGGRGNHEMRSPRRTTPEYAQPGLPGEERQFKVVLKLIADFGLIGLPNVGKSSLLNELTKANAKVANYPFTTLEPNLGVLNGKVFADIPGLIEGASSGKGLGIKFLKHIEKVKILLHCISAESEDPLKDYEIVFNELKSFSPELAKKKQTILLTKADMVSKDVLKEKTTLIKKLKKQVIPVSIHDWDSLQGLIKKLKV